MCFDDAPSLVYVLWFNLHEVPMRLYLWSPVMMDLSFLAYFSGLTESWVSWTELCHGRRTRPPTETRALMFQFPR